LGCCPREPISSAYSFLREGYFLTRRLSDKFGEFGKNIDEYYQSSWAIDIYDLLWSELDRSGPIKWLFDPRAWLAGEVAGFTGGIASRMLTSRASTAAELGFEEGITVFPSLSRKNIESLASSIAKSHASNFECMECAADIVNTLKKEGVNGSIIDLNVKNGGK
jgi:hypothetical protein